MFILTHHDGEGWAENQSHQSVRKREGEAEMPALGSLSPVLLFSFLGPSIEDGVARIQGGSSCTQLIPTDRYRRVSHQRPG